MDISLNYRFVFALQDVGSFKDAEYFDHCVGFRVCNTV